MAKGLEKHQARVAKLNALGKDLTRRAGSKCELCSSSGTALSVYEVPPAQDEPTADDCVFICETCKRQLENSKSLDANHWRCACESVWSEVPAVQVVAARVLDRLGRREVWAREALEAVDFDEEVEEWIAKAPL